jgi:hypothetical protein
MSNLDQWFYWIDPILITLQAILGELL